MSAKLTQMLEEFKEARKKFFENAQVTFKDSLKEFFDNNPDVHTITWTQFSPYFNDGDECVFNVHEVQFTSFEPDSEDLSGYEVDIDGETETEWVYPAWKAKFGPKNPDDCDALASIIGSAEMEDIMHEMFGNHARVVINRDGITVDEYEHD